MGILNTPAVWMGITLAILLNTTQIYAENKPCFVESLSTASPTHAIYGGYIRINGKIPPVTPDDPTNHRTRGIQVVQLSMQGSSCSVVEGRQYDTYSSDSAATALATYINSLPSGAVLVGTSLDEYTLSLGNAETSLNNYGIVPGIFQSPLTFIMTAGDVSKTKVHAGEAHQVVYMTSDGTNASFRAIQPYGGNGVPVFSPQWNKAVHRVYRQTQGKRQTLPSYPEGMTSLNRSIDIECITTCSHTNCLVLNIKQQAAGVLCELMYVPAGFWSTTVNTDTDCIMVELVTNEREMYEP